MAIDHWYWIVHQSWRQIGVDVDVNGDSGVDVDVNGDGGVDVDVNGDGGVDVVGRW